MQDTITLTVRMWRRRPMCAFRCGGTRHAL